MKARVKCHPGLVATERRMPSHPTVYNHLRQNQAVKDTQKPLLEEPLS